MIDKGLYGTEAILFVDDEKVIITLYQEILNLFGYRVTSMVNPEKAYELFKKNPKFFDLVITDMSMPEMTGDKLLKKFKTIRFDIPVILCTGYGSIIDENKARQHGFSGYLMKPVSISNIAKMIRNVLDKSKLSF